MSATIEADVVIVGAGLAGFAAALEAARLGADVLLLEKLENSGGSSAMSGGFFAFAGTEMQKASGIEDSNDLLFKDLRQVGEEQNDASLVRAYVDEQLPTFKWLQSIGIEFVPLVEASSGQSVPRSHGVDPADMMRTLATLARNNQKITVMKSVRAHRLLKSPQTGAVTGLTALRGDELLTLTARRGVVLTSGGFTRDPDLIHRFAPACDNAMVTGAEQNVGDGLRMAWQLGADVRDTAYIKATYGKHPGENTTLHSCLAVYKGAIAINEEGKRFVDESVSYKLLGDACLRQPYGISYQIFDQGIYETGDNRIRMLDFERRMEDGLFISAESLGQLAQKLEIPAEVLEHTVEQYNAAVTAGKDEQFGRQHLVHNYGELRRIDRAPFYAYPSTVIVFGTYCGLRVDASMRVLDVYGEPIQGLLAAGEVVGGFHGAAYMTGTALGKAAVFGRIAARTVAQ